MKKITLAITLILAFILAIVNETSGRIGDHYKDMPDRCLQPMDYGYCRAKMKRFYFNYYRNRCSPFFFGGCAGNANNFETLEECNELCGNKELVPDYR